MTTGLRPFLAASIMTAVIVPSASLGPMMLGGTCPTANACAASMISTISCVARVTMSRKVENAWWWWISTVGCCFGMKNKFDGLRVDHFVQMLNFIGYKWEKGLDQEALANEVWPFARLDMVAHDSYLCLNFTGNVWPWPTQRISGPGLSEPSQPNFVGSNGGKISINAHGPCPVECRPPEHQDWLLC